MTEKSGDGAYPIPQTFAQLQNDYHKLLSEIDGPAGYKVRLGNMMRHIADLEAQNAVLRAHPPLAAIGDGKIYGWNAGSGRWDEVDVALIQQQTPAERDANGLLYPRALPTKKGEKVS